MKNALLAIGGILAIFLLTWGGIYVNGFFNAEREAQRNKVFKESQSYNDGMRKQLNDLYLAYQAADETGKIGIRNAVRDIFASVDTTGYPVHLQNFLSQTGAR